MSNKNVLYDIETWSICVHPITIEESVSILFWTELVLVSWV